MRRIGSSRHQSRHRLMMRCSDGDHLIHEQAAWEIGRAAAEFRAMCEDAELCAAQGIAGDNPNQRFGRWSTENFRKHHKDTLYNARRLFEVFGDRQRNNSTMLVFRGMAK